MPLGEAHNFGCWLKLDTRRKRPINQNFAARWATQARHRIVRSISSTTAAASAWSASSTVIGKARGLRDDLAHEKIHVAATSTSSPTMAPAALH